MKHFNLSWWKDVFFYEITLLKKKVILDIQKAKQAFHLQLNILL